MKDKHGCGTIDIQQEIPNGGASCINNRGFEEKRMKCGFKFERTCDKKQGTVDLNHRGQKFDEYKIYWVDVCELDVNPQRVDLYSTVVYAKVNKSFYLK